MGTTGLSQSLLVYDGDCAFCTLWVTRLSARLPDFPRVTTSQAADLDELGLSDEDVRDYAWLLTPTRHLAGAAAFAGLLKGQRRWGWRFMGHLLDTWPLSVLADLGYRLVARFRHRLPGSTASCEIPRDAG